MSAPNEIILDMLRADFELAYDLACNGQWELAAHETRNALDKIAQGRSGDGPSPAQLTLDVPSVSVPEPESESALNAQLPNPQLPPTLATPNQLHDAAEPEPATATPTHQRFERRKT